jgi:hypothetical protein
MVMPGRAIRSVAMCHLAWNAYLHLAGARVFRCHAPDGGLRVGEGRDLSGAVCRPAFVSSALARELGYDDLQGTLVSCKASVSMTAPNDAKLFPPELLEAFPHATEEVFFVSLRSL